MTSLAPQGQRPPAGHPCHAPERCVAVHRAVLVMRCALSCQLFVCAHVARSLLLRGCMRLFRVCIEVGQVHPLPPSPTPDPSSPQHTYGGLGTSWLFFFHRSGQSVCQVAGAPKLWVAASRLAAQVLASPVRCRSGTSPVLHPDARLRVVWVAQGNRTSRVVVLGAGLIPSPPPHRPVLCGWLGVWVRALLAHRAVCADS